MLENQDETKPNVKEKMVTFPEQGKHKHSLKLFTENQMKMKWMPNNIDEVFNKQMFAFG